MIGVQSSIDSELMLEEVGFTAISSEEFRFLSSEFSQGTSRVQPVATPWLSNEPKNIKIGPETKEI
jgi:hypothetical protein